MNILSLSRKEVENFIGAGVMRPENLKHYDVCKAMAEGMTQEAVAEKYNLTDRWVRRMKEVKCPKCEKVI